MPPSARLRGLIAPGRPRWVALWLLAFPFLCAASHASAGMGWISAQVGVDGGIGAAADVATRFQSTAEALRAAAALNGLANPLVAPGYAFIDAEPFENTEYLARKIIAASEVGKPGAIALVDRLLTHQNHDGGFGDLPGYPSTPLDTAFALEALALAGLHARGETALGVGYLLAAQRPDGGWSDDINEASLYISALALGALRHYVSRFALANETYAAEAFLYTQQTAVGGWATPWETAQVLLAVVPLAADPGRYAAAANALRAAQLTDGSWEEGVFSTALALRALAMIEDPPVPPTLSEVRGSVLDADTRLPLQGVSVILSGAADRDLLTAGDGAFVFAALGPGRYVVEIEFPDYTGLTFATVAGPGQGVDLGPLLLSKTPAAATGTVRGVISDVSGGAGLPGASVAVTGVPGQTYTDVAGVYQIANVPAGVITLQVSKAGYSSSAATAELAAGGLAVYSTALSPVAIPLSALSGTVIDGGTGEPLDGVRVSVVDAPLSTTLTDGLGRYRIEDPSIRAGAVTYALAGYDGVTIAFALAEGQALTLSPKLYSAGTTPPGANGARVTGVVVDAGSGRPLAGVAVMATFGAREWTVYSATDGRFDIAGIGAPVGSLRFIHSGYAALSLGVSPEPLAFLDLGEVRLREAAALDLLPDLVVATLDEAAAVTDVDTLRVSGTLHAALGNIGTREVNAGVEVLVFYDADQDGVFDAATDIVFGSSVSSARLDPGQSESMAVALEGEIPFRDAPLSLWVDSAQRIAEGDESNNVAVTLLECAVDGAAAPDTVVVEEFAADVTRQQGPTAFGFDSHGILYFSGGDSGAAFRFVGGSTIPEPFGSIGVADPDGLAIDSADNVIITGDPVTKFAPDGVVVWQRHCPIGNVQLVTVDALDNIYVGSLGTDVCKLSADGVDVTLFGGFNQPSEPVIGPDGFLYVAQLGPRNIVKASATTGEIVGIVASGISGAQPVFDANGDLFVAETGTGRIFKIDLPAGEVTIFAEGLGAPRALAFDTAGNLFVGDTAAKKIYKLSTTPTPRRDLSIARLVVIDRGAGQPVSFSARVGNAGGAPTPADVTVAIYAGNPAVAGVLLGSAVIGPLAPGGYADVQIDGPLEMPAATDFFAVVDSDDVVAECDESNNVVTLSSPSPTLGAINVSTDSALYGSNAAAVIEAQIVNTGTLPGEFHAELWVSDEHNVHVAQLEPIDAGALESGAATRFFRTWNTRNFVSGAYRLHGLLQSGSGAVLDEASSPFAIEPAPNAAAVTLRLTADRSVYHTHDVVDVEHLVRNATQNTLVGDAVLQLSITDAGGRVVVSQDVDLGQLVFGGLKDSHVLLPLVDVAPGHYTIQGVVMETGVTDARATHQIQFDVKHDPVLSLSGYAAVEQDEVDIGQTQICRDIVENVGSVVLEPLELRQALVNVGEQLEIDARTHVLVLGVGEQHTLVRHLGTTGLPEGDYACLLQVRVGDAWQTLDAAGFRLNRPPVVITAALGMGPRGRLLVLGDAPTPQAATGSATTCPGIASIALQTRIDPALEVDAALTARLLDEQGLEVDQENAALSAAAFPVDDSISAAPVDLSLEAVSDTRVTLVLSARDAVAVTGSYRVELAVAQGGAVTTRRSEPIDMSCTAPIVHDSLSGDFWVLGAAAISARDGGAPETRDPFGPTDAPSLEIQYARLDDALRGAGWSYTLATSADDFTRELASGGYEAIVLAAEHVKLSGEALEHLHKAVEDGKGLLVAGYHDQRNSRVTELLGIRYLGDYRKATGVALSESVLHEEAQASFQNEGAVAWARSEGAEVAGHFLFDAAVQGRSHSNIAVTRFSYGLGRSVYIGFDLLMQLASAPQGGLFEGLLIRALEDVHPQHLSAVAAGVLPIRLSMQNQGIPTPGSVLISLPPGSAVIDAGTATSLPDGGLAWSFDLPTQGASATLNFWLKAPDAASLSVVAAIKTGVTPEWVDYATLVLDLALEAPP